MQEGWFGIIVVLDNMGIEPIEKEDYKQGKDKDEEYYVDGESY